MKKLTYIILAFLSATLVHVACDEEPQKATAPQQKSDAASESTAKAAAKLELEKAAQKAEQDVLQKIEETRRKMDTD